MSGKEPILSLNRPLGVLQPEEEKGYLIPLSDWSFLRSKIDKIEEPTVLYNTVGAILIGVAGSALLAGLGLLAVEKISIALHAICWVIFALCLVSGGICLYFDNTTRKQYNFKSKIDALEEMDRLAKRYKTEISVSNENSSPTEIADNLILKFPINKLQGPFTLVGFHHKDVVQNIPFSNKLVFKFEIHREDIIQDFHIYYNVLFSTGKQYWIGFKKSNPGSPDAIDSGEYTKVYDFHDLFFSHEETIADTLANRDITNFGVPMQILFVRIRASDTIKKPIIFSFGFTTKD
jgi:hypothetical protein